MSITNNKETVKLRQRVRPSGNISLYLDIYRRGVRRQENLKLYLIPEKTRADKEKNRQTLQLAEAIRSKRHMEVINGEYGFSNSDSGDILFVQYAEALAEQRNSEGLRTCVYHIKRYDKRQFLTFNDITPQWVEGFMRYLDKVPKNKAQGERLHVNSKRLYIDKLRAIIHHAQRKGIIHNDPLRGVDNWKAEETTREFLTVEEVRRIAATHCDSDQIRRAFLFSCLTGLRRSDVERLRWGDTQTQGEFIRIVFHQKKTKGLEYLDVSPQARALMGERGGDDALIFGALPSTGHTNHILQKWVLRAGIDKRITFHCARHSFAIMMLDIGTDIYTVSKLLGHRELKTTQIYAKVLDKSKQKAVANIPNLW